MPKIILYIFPFLIIVSAIQCESQQAYQAEIVQEGCVECFAENTTYENGLHVSCELSGVTFFKNNLIFVNEQPIPGTTSEISFNFQIPFKKPDYLGNEFVKNARELEDIALTPQQKFIFAVTSFDRYDPKDRKYDVFNMLIYGSATATDSQKIAYPTYNSKVVSSIRLRPVFQHALRSLKYKDGPEYFKIEGIAALPNKVLLFGIREMGNSPNDFETTVTIIGAHYDIINGQFFFKDTPRVVFQFFPNETEPSLESPLGLSSLEYDAFNKRLYILTNYEKGKKDTDVGAYLWVVPLKEFLLKEQKMQNFQKPVKYKLNIGRQIRGQYKLEINSKPILVRTKNKLPLKFAHKASGIAVMEDNTVFIIHDDDRILGSDFVSDKQNQFHRKLNQACYSIVQFE
jgi:hypothetical protein